MSKYTTQLRWIIEQSETDAHGTYDQGVYTDASYKAIGLDSYPIFSEDYRVQLNNKIIDHFYFREIGMETVANFKWFMRRTMSEIMPYYNQLYQSVDIITDPIDEINVTYTDDNKVNTESTGTTNTNDDSSSVYSNTPMDEIEGGLDTIKQGNYATNVTYDLSDSESTSNSSTESIQDRTRTEKGHRKSQSDLLLRYRETFINVDLMILEELENLFMGVW